MLLCKSAAEELIQTCCCEERGKTASVLHLSVGRVVLSAHSAIRTHTHTHTHVRALLWIKLWNAVRGTWRLVSCVVGLRLGSRESCFSCQTSSTLSLNRVLILEPLLDVWLWHFCRLKLDERVAELWLWPSWYCFFNCTCWWSLFIFSLVWTGRPSAGSTASLQAELICFFKY